MAAFTKRTFEGFGYFRRELCFIWRERRAVRALLRGKNLDAAFRERIMMAVTAVNRCRYCSFVHTRAALKEGVSQEELDGFYDRNADPAPAEERVALLYAQHWAETQGMPDEEAVNSLNAAYSPETVQAIQVAIRFINANNLFGNTCDALLHTLSFGVLGNDKP